MISFRPVTSNNFKECIKIETGVSEKMSAPIVAQIAMSYVYPSKVPLAVYDDDELIGFVSYEKETKPKNTYDILVVVIRSELQGRGLGRLTMEKFIEYLFDLGDCDVITLNFNPENDRAESLYKSFGFKETGKMFGDEIILELKRGKDGG